MTDAHHDEDLFRFASLDDAHGPARPLSVAETDLLVASVLDGALIPPTSSGSGTGTGVTGGKLVLGLATIAFISGGAAFVARTPRAHRVATTEIPAEVIPGTGVPAPEEEPVVQEPELAPRRRRAQVAAAPRVEPREERRIVAPTPAPAETVVDMLAEANRLRRSGSYAQAESMYRQVVQTNPRAREAHVARVAAAGLRLDRLGDAAGAARLYRDAMRGRGALAAEATFGYARASRVMGDRNAEIQALQAIVERHRSSPYVRPATERLRTLGVTVPPREGE